MSDENMNNNEETAALFVSAQRKKKAEEEAKKKAAEEQAKREAAEAEVRRMEQEVEERKRKAEEERIALEKAEQERAQRKAEMEKVIKDSANAIKEAPNAIKESKVVKKAAEGVKETGNAVKGNNKTKLFIAIGAALAVVVAVVLIIVFAGSSPKEVSYDTIKADGVYASSNEEYSVQINYPEETYTGVSEEAIDNGILIHFNENNSCTVDADYYVIDLPEKYGDNSVAALLTYKTNELANDFALATQNVLDKHMTIASIADEYLVGTEIELPSEFYYFFQFELDDSKTRGRVYASMAPNSNGDVKILIGCFSEEAEDYQNVDNMATVFAESNFDQAVKVPGSDASGLKGNKAKQLVDDIHMSFQLPESFVRQDLEGGNASIFYDNNGAQMMVVFSEYTDDINVIDNDKEGFIELLHTNADQSGFANSFEIRENISRETIENAYCGAKDEYKGIYGGINYWEVDYSSIWLDETTQKVYTLFFYCAAPEANKADYAAVYEDVYSLKQDE